MTGRDALGRFIVGNQRAALGWQGLVQRRFAGDEEAARRWWGLMGAWHYDRPYRERGLGHMINPGQPEEFLQRWQATNALLDTFTLNDVPEMEF